MHIRKPGSSLAERRQLMNALPECYHKRIIIGEKLMDEQTCHSCHSLEELREQLKNPQFRYLSLSPIFDSVSKVGYKSAFTKEDLLAARDEGIINERVLAMGGITRENLDKIEHLGFGGAMVLGDAWPQTQLPVVLSIAGSDPSAGAGIQQDLKTITNCGGYGTTVITSLTSQNTQGVRSTMPVPAEVVESQLRAIFDDMRVEAVKIGIIPNAAIARVIIKVLHEQRRRQVLPIVYDPILYSTSGHPLIDEEGLRLVQEELFPMCTLLTPNLPEAAQLFSEHEFKNLCTGSMPAFPCNLLLKGGHAEGDTMIDRLWLKDEHREERYSSPKIDTKNLHGTGCTLSSAIATYMAKGESLATAVGHAKTYVTRAIQGGKNLHLGHGNGPLWMV